MPIFTYLFFGLILSCSTIEHVHELPQWEEATLEQLEIHPYFSRLSLRKKTVNGLEHRQYHDHTRFRTKASCDALGGCLGISEIDCYYRFWMKGQDILKANRRGQCPQDDRHLP